jgi:hypothetical protein
MNKLKLFVVCFIVAFSSSAQMVQSNGPLPAIDTLSDDFSGSTLSSAWKFAHESEKYASKLKSVSVENGVLKMQPYTSGWYADFQAPLLYKTIRGDFDVRAKVKVSAQNGQLPSGEWSLAGLMVRQPKRTDALSWQPKDENWLFITTGIAQPSGVPVFETKTTNNSMSNLKLRPAKEGWVELRIVRVDAAFILLYRYAGEKWTIADRFYRPLLSPVVQVGLNAYTGWNNVPADLQRDTKKFNETVLSDIPADMILSVDHIQFKRPVLKELSKIKNNQLNLPYYSAANVLTDYNVSNETVLEIIGN